MFKLHDKTRRLLTLLIFLLLGPALLFVVVAKGCSRHSVRTVAGWEALLTDALGQHVEIESVRFPAPGVVRFSQMRVLDPETNEVFLQIPRWELIECFGEMPHSMDPAWMSQANGEDDVPSAPHGGSLTECLDNIRARTPYQRGLLASFGFAWSSLFGKQPRYLHCEIPKIACYGAAVPHAKDTLLALAAKQPGAKANRSQTNVDLKPTVLFIGTMDVFYTDGKPGNPTLPAWEVADASPRQSQIPKPDCVTITDACFEFRPAEEQTTLLAIFQQADQPSDAKPIQLALSHRRHPVVLTRVQFMSGDNEVPNRILTGLDPFFAAFGQQSRFNGNIIAEKSVDQQKNRTRSLELNQAAFSNIALDALLSKSLTFRLDGTADKVILDSVRFYGESNDAETLRLEHAKGRMYNAKGLASWPGLQRLVQGTKLQLSPQDAKPPDTDITFRNGTFAFRIDAQGIQFFPASDQSQQRLPLVVIDNHCAVFMPNPGHVIRYVDLFASLAQPNTQQIPLMPETQHLIATLPIEIQRDVTAIDAPSLQVMDLPPAVNRENVSSMMPVPSMPAPSMTHDPPMEQYQRQSHQQAQLALGHGANGTRQPDSSVMPQQPLRDDSYIPAQRPGESPFGLQQNSSRHATPTSQPAMQPTVRPLLTQLQSPQSNGVPYGGHSQQHTAVHPSPNRVIVPTLSGNLNRVQTDPMPVVPGSFNNEMPATFAPYQQTQVASAPLSQYYDNMPATAPSATTPSGQSSFSPFGLLETNSQYGR